jgi:acyl-CoA synthetase (AMP-forming)/AMP-acid ligase II/pimeloyl-ACP methyl ester carboxylesterase
MSGTAALPPPGLPGLDPRWSRIVEAAGSDGTVRGWHVLDTHAHVGPEAPPPPGTLLAVHGNPTWSYLWRSLLAAPPQGWRVVAVDHLGMGFSERVPTFQRLADRVRDLGAVSAALGIDGPVVTVAHDWGGPISLGWALEHRDQLAGVVLTNTAVSQPGGSRVPALIALARARGVLRRLCVSTPGFLDGTLRLAHPPLERAVRDAYRAPYRDARRRQAIGDFVADIPLEPEHPSAPALQAVAAGVRSLDVPALLLWGARDPVFADRYLRDLLDRLPQADLHRYPRAGHLLAEDVDLATPVAAWVGALAVGSPVPAPTEVGPGSRPLWAALEDRADDRSPAVVEMSGARRSASWADLDTASREVAAGLAAAGVQRGDRVALLVPPGVDLVTTLYGCWRAGAVVVVADAGLGARGLTRAVAAAAPRMVVGIPRALAAARALRWPGERVLVGGAPAAGRAVLGVSATLDELRAAGRTAPAPAPPGPDDEAAVLFTSGATGPAKGVVYRHRQLQAQRDLVAATYGVDAHDRLVAAFAPFALYGPALGIASAVPDMDVTATSTLTAGALSDAVRAVDATLVFGAPAALVNVVATAADLDPEQRDALAGVRLVLSAGAPVPVPLLEQVAALTPKASVRTPYGMTEALPVTDVSLDELRTARMQDAGPGVCVGRPLQSVRIEVLPLAADGTPDPVARPATTQPHVAGEIVVHAPHVKERYDGLWATQRDSVTADGGHRTGDVGHLDVERRLWVEGRLVHVLATARGPVTPVGAEQLVEALPVVGRAALVGVGPPGAQVPVVVVEPVGLGDAADLGRGRGGLASPALSAAVRAAAAPLVADVAAVLVVRRLPVDIRHNSKVDRVRVARWAARVLAGERVGAP